MNDRLNPIEDIETDVRTYGILVRDYSRPGALRFPHKSFFELIFAKYIARLLLGEEKEEVSAIASATEVKIGSLIEMPELVAFLAEILGRKGRASSSSETVIRDLFNLVVLGSKLPIPNFVGACVLLHFLARKVRSARYLMMFLTVFPMTIFSAFMFRGVEIMKFDIAAAGSTHLLINFPLLSVAAFAMTLMVFTFSFLGQVSFTNRVRIWHPIVRSLGFRSKDFKRIYGRFISRWLDDAFDVREE